MFHQPLNLFLDNRKLQTQVILPRQYFQNITEPQTTSHYKISSTDIFIDLICTHDITILSTLDQQMEFISLFCEIVEVVLHCLLVCIDMGLQLITVDMLEECSE